MYFDTRADLERYFPDGVPSNVLAIVKETGGLYTSSNNESSGGSSQEQGGEPISDQDREYVEYTLEGEPKPLEDGWYAVDEGGNYIPFEMRKPKWGCLTIGAPDNFSYYFIYIENGSQTTYYPIDDYDWLDINDPVHLSDDSNKYSNNRISKEDKQAGELNISWSINTWQIDSALQ